MGAFHIDPGVCTVNLTAFLLLSVPGLPLLLALSALRSRLSWPCHIALLPAVVLLLVPAVFSIEVPWLLFGVGFGIDGNSRLFLVMSVVLWAVAATLLSAPAGNPAGNRATTFFLLTLAGHLGAILATDLVGFFVFSTLMGYGFYALLVDGGDEIARRAGRVYLVFLVLADLLLFEALLVAAVTTEDLGFESVRQAITQSPSLNLYLSMVVTGFALKAGIWPLHFWLTLAFRSVRPVVALLLAGVPVAIGLLGMLRWLPLGEISTPELGLIIQGLGWLAMVYAILAGLIQARLKLLPAYATIIFSGLFIIAMGMGLGDATAWARYGNQAHFFIVSLVLVLALLASATGWLDGRDQHSAKPAKLVADPKSWFERWSRIVVRWGGQMGFNTLPRLRAAFQAAEESVRQMRTLKRVLDTGECYLQRWALAVTLLLLLGISIVLVGLA